MKSNQYYKNEALSALRGELGQRIGCHHYIRCIGAVLQFK